jgi:hypothetical protein
VHTFVPQLGKEVRFHYFWGVGQTLLRAPWEPMTVPYRRFINDPALR